MPFVNRGSYTTPSTATSFPATITGALAGGGVLWVAVCARDNSTSSTTTCTVTMPGATFTQVRKAIADTTRALFVFYSQDYDPGASQTITFTYNQGQTRLVACFDEETDGRTSGSPVAQSNAAVAGAGATGVSTTLTAGVGGRTYVAVATSLTSTGQIVSVPGTSVELAEPNATSLSLQTHWNAALQTAPGVTWTGTATGYAVVAIGVAAAASAQAEIAWAKLEVPAPPAQAEVAWASFEVPTPIPPSAQVAYARFEVPDAPAVPDPWDPAPECETLEYRNPAGRWCGSAP